MTHPTIIQIGNQGSTHATEAAYRDGYQHAGCHVIGIPQEEAKARGPQYVIDQCDVSNAAMLVYSRTHNNTALGPEWTDTWRTLESRGTQTIGVHLDVFWGLSEREDWILRDHDPMFTVGTLFTADGGSDDKWKAAGVNHVWLPPGCDTRFVPEQAEPFEELADKIVFVGSSNGYHPAYPARNDLINHARTQYGPRFIEFGGGSVRGVIRGGDLARIYASDCIVIGDSCFAGTRASYWSDRIPETLGRGGFLIHPWLMGLRSMYDGTVLATFAAGDYNDLDARIGEFLANPGEREGNRERGRALVWRRDTYRHRAREVLDIMGIDTEDAQ